MFVPGNLLADMESYHNVTTAHPMGLAILVALAIWMFLSPRRTALLPFLILICFIPSAQRVVIAGSDFTMLRLMAIAGMARVVCRSETSNVRFNRIDLVYVAWVVVASIVYILQRGQATAAVYVAGMSLDMLGAYLVARVFIQTMDDFRAFARGVAIIAIPVGAFFAFELATQRNLIAIFCAGTPSTRGTLELLKQVGVDDPDRVTSLRYRGRGWPGMWTVSWTDAAGNERTEQRTYAESWGFLQKYRQWRCYICPDHTGEFADIAVGDPWYRETQPGELGKSLILARTRRGREIPRAASDAGYIQLEKEDPTLLPRSQPNLLATRGALWGRLWALRCFGGAMPRFQGFKTFRFWRRNLSSKEKLQSILGTRKRLYRKRLRERIKVQESFLEAKQ